MPSEKWIVQQTHNNFWLEASFLTLWGSERSLRRAGFARSFHDFNGFRSYLKFWSNEVCAVARIHPKTSRTGHVRVTISYYDGKGHRFRELGNALEEAPLGGPLTLANTVAATSAAPSARSPMSQPRARAPQPPGQYALWSEDPDPPPMTPEQLDKWAERIAKLMGVKLDPARWKKSRRKPPPS